MTTTSQPRLPAIGFAILSITLFLGGLGTLGAFLLLDYYYPANTTAQSTAHTATVLAVNGVVGCFLAIMCALSGWRSFKRTATARSFALVTWWLVAGFVLWVLIFDAASGWSAGGVAEVITWSFLETLIAVRLRRTNRLSVA